MIDPDALVTGPDAAAYLSEITPTRITTAMLRQWSSRGWVTDVLDEDGQVVLDRNGKPKRRRRYLEAVDHEGHRGAARYRWRDIAEAERDTRKNPRSPGRRVLVTV